MMKFSHHAKNDKLTPSAEKGLLSIEWCIDAAFAAHPHFRSHGGMTVKFEGSKGAVVAASEKQTIDTDSSTASELAGVHQFPSKVLWTPLFMEAQGCPIKKKVVNQDNKSAMSLVKNGGRSSGKHTRVLNIRCFMTTDQAEKGNVEIEHCSADDVMADFMTKPSHGVKFHTFRNQAMGFD